MTCTTAAPLMAGSAALDAVIVTAPVASALTTPDSESTEAIFALLENQRCFVPTGSPHGGRSGITFSWNVDPTYTVTADGAITVPLRTQSTCGSVGTADVRSAPHATISVAAQPASRVREGRLMTLI